MENRQQTGYDELLPGGGLLVWHVDDDQQDNADENHYLVGLVQADGRRDLERSRNRGDAGDCYPGTSANTALTPTSTPSTRSYAGQDTAVSISQISAAGATMTATVSVSPATSPAAYVPQDEQAAVPAPRTNGEVTTALANLESDLESLKRLMVAGGTATG